MSEEQLKELQEYNLEYLEAQQSEEIFGGDYTSAVELKYAKKEIERLNNIINSMEKFFQYAYDNEVREINDRKVSVWTICLDKLQELKGSDSNDN